MERDSIDRIRSATFPIGRRGYEKREVDGFLNDLADWLETGGADQSRAEIVRRDLERVGEQTGKILTDAYDAAAELRADAEREAAELLEEATAEAERTRAAAQVHGIEVRERADREAREIEEKATAEASQHVAEARRRREDIEAVISDLEERRDAVIAEMERLSSELAGSATQYRDAEAEPETEASEATSAG